MGITVTIIFSIALCCIIAAAAFTGYFLSENFGKKSYGVMVIIAALIIIAGFGAGDKIPGHTGDCIYSVAAILLGFLFYLFLSALIAEALIFSARLYWRIIRHQTINPHGKTAGFTAIAVAAAISISGIANAADLRTKYINIPIDGLKKNVHMVLLTDIHLGHLRGKKFMREIVDRTNALHPDFVAITGDLFDTRGGFDKEKASPIRNIKAPVFFVEGNHDIYSGIDSIKAMLRKEGVHVLENSMEMFDGIQIAGLNYMLADSSSFDLHSSICSGNIKSTLPNLNIDKSFPCILLHHAPNGIKYASEAGVDLYLCGHTHGGQMFPLTVVAKFMFEYSKGLHYFYGKDRTTAVYVSEGEGTAGPPMRICTVPEITSITLVPEEK